MPTSLYDNLNNFDTMVYTVGDGSPHGNESKTATNALSRGNALRAARLVEKNDDAILFIAGGNDGENGARNRDGVKGSLPEAERMKLDIGLAFPASVRERVIADTDPEFLDRYGKMPSGNTPWNSENAAAVMWDGRFRKADVVAEINHFGRVFGTFRRELQKLGILDKMEEMRGFPLISNFETSTNQIHIQTRKNFASPQLKLNPLRAIPWEYKAKVHHLLTGKVLRREFAWEMFKAQIRQVLCQDPEITDEHGTYVPDLPYKKYVQEIKDMRRLDQPLNQFLERGEQD